MMDRASSASVTVLQLLCLSAVGRRFAVGVPGFDLTDAHM